MNDTVDGRNPAPVDMVVCPIMYRVLYIPGGCSIAQCPDKTSEDAVFSCFFKDPICEARSWAFLSFATQTYWLKPG